MDNKVLQLDPKKDYGFTLLNIKNSNQLPEWDTFRLEKIKQIFTSCDLVVDFGDSSRALSGLFFNSESEKRRITVDINESYHPDIVADICDLEVFKSNSVDGIICAAILEHVYNPFLAVSELFRILKPSGQLFVYVPWLWKYHAPPSGEFLDYYRFSIDGIRFLFKDFSHLEIMPVRGPLETIMLLIPGFGKKSKFIKYFGRIIRKIDRYNEKLTSGYNVFLKK